MVNNFENFREIINLTEPGDFYYINAIIRRKDHPDLSKSEKCIDSFYIYSLDEYDHLVPKMIEKAEKEGARIYVRVNKRNDKKVALQYIAELARRISEEDYAGVRKIYTSICGKYGSEKDRKIFLVDVDVSDPFFLIEVAKYIRDLRIKNNMEEKVHTHLKTRNGYHILTSPFNINEFKKKYPGIQVDADSSTLLYVNL